jgi:hypothetical protein
VFCRVGAHPNAGDITLTLLERLSAYGVQHAPASSELQTSSFSLSFAISLCGRPMVGGRGRRAIVERYLSDGKPAEHSPIAVVRLLLVQTWRPIRAVKAWICWKHGAGMTLLAA